MPHRYSKGVAGLKFTPHAKDRMLERYGTLDIPNDGIEFVQRQTHTRTLCRIRHTDIHFILNRPDRLVITVLPKDAPQVQKLIKKKYAKVDPAKINWSGVHTMDSVKISATGMEHKSI